MSHAPSRTIALMLLALAACSDDTAPADAAVDLATPDLAADLGRDAAPPDLRPPDLYPTPDTVCTPPCVQTIPHGVLRPMGVALDKAGTLVIAESGANRIVTMVPGAKPTTLAGTGQGLKDGPALQAQFDFPHGLALDGAGKVYVADYGNQSIRMIEAGQVSTLAGDGTPGYVDGPAASAHFTYPSCVAVDSNGAVFVADSQNHCIRVVQNGMVSTLAGDGTPGHVDGPTGSARFYHPRGLAVDSSDRVYVADQMNHCIRVIEAGQVSTLAGDGMGGMVDGPASQAQFRDPTGLALDTSGALYVADYGNHAIRVVQNGTVSTVAGDGSNGLTDGPAAQAEFSSPSALAVATDGTIYVADQDNDRIRVIRQ